MSDDLDICVTCNGEIPENSVFVTCSSCENCYHTGNCSGLSARSLRRKKADGSLYNWKCKICVPSAEQNDSRPVGPGQSDMTGLANEMAGIREQLGTLLPIVQKIDSLLELKETVADLKGSVEYMSAKYDEVLAGLSKQESEIADIKKRLARVENTPTEREVSELRRQVNDLEQYGRRQNLEIHGIPLTKDECLLDIVNGLAHDLSLSLLTEQDIDGIHRLPSKPDRVPPILVRFVSRRTKENWQGKRKELQKIKPELRFYDNLTPQNKHLLHLARARATDMGYCFAWQRDGKVLVRKGPGEPKFRIASEADLYKIGNGTAVGTANAELSDADQQKQSS